MIEVLNLEFVGFETLYYGGDCLEDGTGHHGQGHWITYGPTVPVYSAPLSDAVTGAFPLLSWGGQNKRADVV